MKEGTQVLNRAQIDDVLRGVHPKGIAALPRLITMFLGLESVPPELDAYGAILADPNVPIRITISAGDAAPFVVEIA